MSVSTPTPTPNFIRYTTLTSHELSGVPAVWLRGIPIHWPLSLAQFMLTAIFFSGAMGALAVIVANLWSPHTFSLEAGLRNANWRDTIIAATLGSHMALLGIELLRMFVVNRSWRAYGAGDIHHGCRLMGTQENWNAFLQNFIPPLLIGSLYVRQQDQPLVAHLMAAYCMLWILWGGSQRQNMPRALRPDEAAPGVPMKAVSSKPTPAVQATPAKPATQAAQVVQPEEPDDGVPPVVNSQRRSTLTFADIVGMDEVKERLLKAAQEIRDGQKRGAQPSRPARNGVLMHGEPGNGKTMFAQALAGELGLNFISVTRGSLSSQWLGKMPLNIRAAFAQARANQPCVLFFDEIDSIVKSRDSHSGSKNDEDANVTTTFMTEADALRGHQVILMGATNYLDRIDEAAMREGRFDFKVEISPPDEAARSALLRRGAKASLPKAAIHAEDLARIVRRWNRFSAARLDQVGRALVDLPDAPVLRQLRFEHWALALRQVQGGASRVPPHAKPLEDLVFSASLKQKVHSIAQRLSQIVEIEERGGSVPNGVLFFGEPGTGKTATAMAIAKRCDWSFLSVAGPDLLADVRKLDDLYRKAKNMRPAIIFIDEAEDVLRNRLHTSNTAVVNKMLALMDGAREKVSDVVWIAATNHPDQIDPALLRAGRFTEKLAFEPPDRDAIEAHAAAWFAKKAQGQPSPRLLATFSNLMGGQSIANVEGVLQQALNLAISDAMAIGPTTPAQITDSNLRDAFRTVVPRG